MHIETFREYCLKKACVSEDFPFGGDTLVFKVLGKMFALTDVEEFESINLKCNPEKSLELREQYAGIKAGYHMNKKHWNTVNTDESVPDSLIFELIDHSYDLVVSKLPKTLKAELKNC